MAVRLLPVVDSSMCFGVANFADFVTRFREEVGTVFSTVVVDFVGNVLPAIGRESLHPFISGSFLQYSAMEIPSIHALHAAIKALQHTAILK